MGPFFRSSLVWKNNSFVIAFENIGTHFGTFLTKFYHVMTVGIKHKVLLHYNVDLYHFNLKALCFSKTNLKETRMRRITDAYLSTFLQFKTTHIGIKF